VKSHIMTPWWCTG